MSTTIEPGVGQPDEARQPARARSGRPVRLVGIEEELLLVDAETMAPVPAIADILGAAGPASMLPWGATLECEVKAEQVEIVSPPLRTHGELLDAIVDGRRAADEAARVAGARAVALATAPPACESHPVPSARFDRMGAQFGLTLREQLTCGFHVHVSIDSADEGVGVLDRIRPWLPMLLALSANSPFWRGGDTDFASYRYQAWGRWPSAGPYDRFGSAAGYRAAVEQAVATGVALDDGMIYFDARLSSHAPTVEVRIADVCLAPEDAATLATLIRALVDRAADDWRAGVPAIDLPTSVLRLASWRASRSGIERDLLHPLIGTPCPAAAAIDALLHHVGGHFTDEAERTFAHRGVAAILRRGTGARQQRAAHGACGSLEGVVADAVLRTHADPRQGRRASVRRVIEERFRGRRGRDTDHRQT